MLVAEACHQHCPSSLGVKPHGCPAEGLRLAPQDGLVYRRQWGGSHHVPGLLPWGISLLGAVVYKAAWYQCSVDTPCGASSCTPAIALFPARTAWCTPRVSRAVFLIPVQADLWLFWLLPTGNRAWRHTLSSLWNLGCTKNWGIGPEQKTCSSPEYIALAGRKDVKETPCAMGPLGEAWWKRREVERVYRDTGKESPEREGMQRWRWAEAVRSSQVTWDHRKGDHLYLQCQVGGWGGFTGGTIGLLFWLPFIQGLVGLYHLGRMRSECLGLGGQRNEDKAGKIKQQKLVLSVKEWQRVCSDYWPDSLMALITDIGTLQSFEGQGGTKICLCPH